MTIETLYKHIVLNNQQIPIIVGTTMKVMELVLDHKAYGWSPEELHFQHPYLTLGQIHSALAYYWDHQPEFDEQIEQDLQATEQLRLQQGITPFESRLRAKNLVR